MLGLWQGPSLAAFRQEIGFGDDSLPCLFLQGATRVASYFSTCLRCMVVLIVALSVFANGDFSSRCLP